MSLNVYYIGLYYGSTCILWVFNTSWLYTLNVSSNTLFNIGIFPCMISWIVMNWILLDMVMRNRCPWVYIILAQSSMFWCVFFNYCEMSIYSFTTSFGLVCTVFPFNVLIFQPNIFSNTSISSIVNRQLFLHSFKYCSYNI